jgi:signal transduction histidine kinase
MAGPGPVRAPHSLVGRLVLWGAVLFILTLPVFWLMFVNAADRISRDGVDTRLLEFAEQVRGYWISVRADGVPDIDAAAGAGGADVDWVWQVARDGQVALRSDLLGLSGTALPVAEGGPTPAFTLRTVETPLGALRIAERVVDEPVAGTQRTERIHYVAGLRMQRYLAYAEDGAARLEPLALLAVIPVAVALLALSAVIIQTTRRTVKQLTDALAAYESGRAERVEGRFAVELQAVADRINALLARNEKLVDRTRRYVSKITHDINHPLAVMKNAVDGGPDADPALMRRQIERMSGLIDRYASLARAIGPEGQSGKRLSVRDVLDDITDGFSILYRRTPLTFEVACDPAAAVALPRHDLEAMVSNLVSNAHKYGETRVRVSAAVDADGGLTVAVEDDGPGIPEAERGGVTAWGRRLDEAPPGTGFGLTIVRDIADLYEGTVTLDTSDLGGLKAVITLPPPRA